VLAFLSTSNAFAVTLPERVILRFDGTVTRFETTGFFAWSRCLEVQRERESEKKYW